MQNSEKWILNIFSVVVYKLLASTVCRRGENPLRGVLEEALISLHPFCLIAVMLYRISSWVGFGKSTNWGQNRRWGLEF